MTDDSRLRLLKGFLRIYGWLSLALFSVLLAGFIVQPASWDPGGRWHWLIWDRVSDHVAQVTVLTDIPMVLLPAIALWLLRPTSRERQSA